ncbi:riboflavin biosynthesis protein RibF [Candidatus Bipolaricaulota bacterium]|nr:riboflavin biosynthesis protein RibF [Candidatus Bipolaricaulota bacterium]
METVVAIGNFDGVHLGHQAVLAETRRKADRHGLRAVVFTFDIPSRCLASPRGSSPRARCILSPGMVKSALLRPTVDQVVSVPFATVRDMDADRFVVEILGRELHAAAVVVGDAFRFGASRAGDASEIRRWLPTGDVTSVPAVLLAGEPISSSRVRACLRQGSIEEATELLGRFPIYAGPVVRGDGIGRRLGAPTINVQVPEETIIPPDGVYAAWCFVESRGFPSAVYIGARPTFRGAEERFETHLLTAIDPEVQPSFCEVHLISWIRPDKRFSSHHQLQQQIQADLVDIKHRLDHPFIAPRRLLG